MQIPEEFSAMVQECAIPAYRYFESTASTNLDGLSWLAEGAPDGAIVFADHQSAGRGRSERKWVTNPESAIAVSIILRLSREEQEKLQLFSALSGVALALALREMYGIPAMIKWPNDVLIHNQKTAGILTEAAWVGERLNGIVVGTGVNLLPASLPPTDVLQFPATCIQAHTGIPVQRFRLLGQFLRNFFLWRKEITRPSFINQWQKSLAFQNETVYIKEDDRVIFSGTLLGVESNGDVRIISNEGRIRKFTVGDVHLRPESTEIGRS